MKRLTKDSAVLFAALYPAYEFGRTNPAASERKTLHELPNPTVWGGWILRLWRRENDWLMGSQLQMVFEDDMKPVPDPRDW